MASTSSTFVYATRAETLAVISILNEMGNIPFPTYKSAKNALKESYLAIQFIEMSDEHRINWLRQVTPKGSRRRRFDLWLVGAQQ